MSAADPLKGYRGRARARLEAFGVRVWSDVRATNDAGSVFEGVILPRSETLDDEHVVMKLKTGYNVGLHVDRVREMIEVGYKEAVYKIPEKQFPPRPDLPRVTLLGTGGTIASRLDYRTGAVIPAFTPGELYGAVPELADLGSQRSSDRPSSDAALNLIHAVRAAGRGEVAEVVICMFGPTSDQYALLHRGTRCRKMHSSYRSTFRTIGGIPLAMVGEDFTYLTDDFRRRDRSRRVRVDTAYEERTTILYYYPGMKPDLVDALVEKGYRGIVIAGTGLGHVNKPLYPALERAVAAGVHVVMTVQTLWGFAQMYVYDTGRDLLDLGIVPLDNMLPETALMKLSWVLGHTDDHAEVLRRMRHPVSGETTAREPHNGYLILQGGLPETDEFVSSHWK
jgi:L-asparaginase/Glu-tRNA(Gln) amidotransferase subunit D